MQNGNDPAHGETAALLRAGARAYASSAADLVLHRAPDAEASMGPGAFLLWQDFLTQRIIELAVAVQLDEPAIFAREVNWSFSAFESRALPADSLSHAMACLGRALETELPAASWALVRPAVELAATGSDQPAPPRLSPDDDFGGLALRFLEATLRGEAREGVALILGSLRDGSSVEDLFERVLLPAQAEVGTMWHLGEIGVGEEHAATEAVRTAMSVLWHESPRGEPNGRSVVMGSVASDRHEAGVRATAFLLELAGYRAACLGADVPAGEFVQTALDIEADAVVVSASMGVHLPRVAETIGAIRERLTDVRVIVGGPAFDLADDIWSRLGADAYAASPRETAEQIR